MKDDKRMELEGLLASRALGALDESEERRLSELAQSVGSDDFERYDRLVGELTAVLEAEAPEDAPMLPPSLAARLVEQGQQALAAAGKESSTGPRLVEDRPPTPSRSGWFAWSGWAVAAALGALLIAQRPEVVVPTPLDELRSAMASTPGAIEIAWTSTEDPAAQSASGDVVWSEVDQSGMMRFRGLEANDPGSSRYQLWIFDAERDARYPIDGGLFDVPAGADEVLVPIDARLDVSEPTLFAVTVESPEGVVVSDRERIVMIAQTGAGVPGQ